MTKEKKCKKALKSIYKNIKQLQEENKCINNFLNFAENLYPQLKKLEAIKDKYNPSPLLAYCIGIDTRDSNQLKKIGIQNNKQILDLILVNEFFNYILKATINEKQNYQNIDECLSYFLNLEDSSKAKKEKSFLEKIFKKNDKNEKNENTFGKILEEKFNLDKDKLSCYINNCAVNFYTSFIGILKKMIDCKLEELNLLENYVDIKEKIDELKKIGIEKKIYVKEGNEEKLLTEEDILKISTNYALKEISFIKEQIAILNNKKFDEFFFQNAVQKHYCFLRRFLLNNIEDDEIIEKLDELDEIVEKKKESFSEYLFKLQDQILEKAKEKAEKGEKKYEEDLFNFINMSINYSKILEEDENELNVLHNIYSPDLHIELNKKANENKEIFPLYSLYISLPEPSLIKSVLNVEMNYIRAKQEKHTKNL